MSEATTDHPTAPRKFGTMRLKEGQHLFQLDPATGEVRRVQVLRIPGEGGAAVLVPDRPTVVALNITNARRKLGLKA